VSASRDAMELDGDFPAGPGHSAAASVCARQWRIGRRIEREPADGPRFKFSTMVVFGANPPSLEAVVRIPATAILKSARSPQRSRGLAPHSARVSAVEFEGGGGRGRSALSAYAIARVARRTLRRGLCVATRPSRTISGVVLDGGAGSIEREARLRPEDDSRTRTDHACVSHRRRAGPLPTVTASKRIAGAVSVARSIVQSRQRRPSRDGGGDLRFRNSRATSRGFGRGICMVSTSALKPWLTKARSGRGDLSPRAGFRDVTSRAAMARRWMVLLTSAAPRRGGCHHAV